MPAILIRTILIYVILLAVMRVSGKRQVGEIQISELVTTFLLSDIAAYPLTDPAIPLMNAIVPLLTIIALEIILSYLTTKCAKLKPLLDGKPGIIIHRGKIQKKEMEKLRLSLEDLLCELRLKDIACIDEVDFAILEQNGKISVFKKGEAALSHPIITDGVLQKDMLKEAEKDMKWLRDTMKAREIQDIRRIFLLSVTNDGKITLIEQKDTERSTP